MTCPATGAPHRYVERGHESGDVVRFCKDCGRPEPLCAACRHGAGDHPLETRVPIDVGRHTRIVVAWPCRECDCEGWV